MGFPFECPVCGHKTNMPQTNADRIRAMSDEELVLFLEEFSFTGCPAPGKDCGESCRDCMMEWLKQPVEE